VGAARATEVIEEIGTYQPLKKGNFTLDLERSKLLVKQGRQPSDTVAAYQEKSKAHGGLRCRC